MRVVNTVLLVAVLTPALTMANRLGPSAFLDAGNGTVLLSGNNITSGCTIFSTGSVSPPAACPTSGAGTFSVEPGSTAPPFSVSSTGTIDNLNFNELSGGPLVDFMTVDGVQFDLTAIATNMTGADIGECNATLIGGLNWASPGATCRPSGSQLELDNGSATNALGQADTVSLSFSVSAEAYTGSSGVNYSAATPYVGIFTMPSMGNIQTVLQALDAPGGTVTVAWSADFFQPPTIVSPEPGTMPLCGSGLLVLAIAARRFTNRRRGAGNTNLHLLR